MNPKDLVGAKKAPLKLVPGPALIGMADGLSVGAIKYGPFNWRLQPIEAMTYVEAAYRHLMAWVDGQDFSEDTEAIVGHPVNHIDHALAGLGILRDAIASGGWVDNRPPKGATADLLRAMDRSTKPVVPQVEEQGETLNEAEARHERLLNDHPFARAVRAVRGGGTSPSEQDCNCPPDWNEHSFECPLFHVGRN